MVGVLRHSLQDDRRIPTIFERPLIFEEFAIPFAPRPIRTIVWGRKPTTEVVLSLGLKIAG